MLRFMYYIFHRDLFVLVKYFRVVTSIPNTNLQKPWADTVDLDLILLMDKPKSSLTPSSTYWEDNE